MSEEWRPIPGFTGYEITANGQVRSFRKRGGAGRRGGPQFADTPKALKPHPHPKKSPEYRSVVLIGPKGGTTSRSVAKLVRLVFGEGVPA